MQAPNGGGGNKTARFGGGGGVGVHRGWARVRMEGRWVSACRILPIAGGWGCSLYFLGVEISHTVF